MSEQEIQDLVNQAREHKHDFSAKKGDGEINLECPICLGMVYQPVTCVGCLNQLYCQLCFSKQEKKRCPICYKYDVMQPVHKVHRMLQQFIDRIQVVCQKDGCCLGGTPLSYSDFINNHVRICLVKSFQCPLKCGTEIQPGQSSDHLKICQNLKTFCNVCQEIVLHKDRPSHDC